MKEDMSVPLEFEAYSKILFQNESITEREFVDFCSLAVTLVGDHWDKRQGLAYHVAGVWLKYKNIQQNDLLEQIGAEFGNLELPDGHAAGSEEGVRLKWDQVSELVKEADQKYPPKQ